MKACLNTIKLKQAGRGKIFKRLPVPSDKKVGEHCSNKLSYPAKAGLNGIFFKKDSLISITMPIPSPITYLQLVSYHTSFQYLDPQCPSILAFLLLYCCSFSEYLSRPFIIKFLLILSSQLYKNTIFL